MIEPTQEQFNAAEQAIQEILQKDIPQLDTGKGSIIRELLVRPYAYVYTQVLNLLQNWTTRTSVSYLATTTDTSDSIADLVASNYFITRKQGTKATGVVTCYFQSTQARIPSGSIFVIDGHTFQAKKTVIVTTATMQDTQYIDYIYPRQFQNYYLADVAIEAIDTGIIQIAQGTQITNVPNISGLYKAALFSPISGGSGNETNASLMQRCMYSCTHMTGSQLAIKNKLLNSDLGVISCSTLGAYDVGNFSVRYNNLNIPVFSNVDCFIKTRNQLYSSNKTLTVAAQGTKYVAYIDGADSQYSGIVYIGKVADSAGVTYSASIQYLSSNSKLDAASARLSIYQKIKITVDSLPAQGKLIVQCYQMPYIAKLAQYISSDANKFIGIDLIPKSAVPATVYATCFVQEYDQDTLLAIRNSIADKINQLPVGQSVLNFGQIVRQVQQELNIKIKMPYSLSISLPMTNGGLYNFVDSTGVVDLKYIPGNYFWNSKVYYYSAAQNGIKLEIL